MKTALIGLFVALLIPAVAISADVENLLGTWSGSWTPKGGVMDAVTVQFQQEGGKLSGKFLSPVAVNFSSVSFDPKTNAVKAEATDPKSNKVYKIDGKMNGFEVKGTMTAGDASGDLLLIKWTYIPH